MASAVEQMRAAGGRLPLAVALDAAEDVLRELQGVPEVETATYGRSEHTLG